MAVTMLFPLSIHLGRISGEGVFENDGALLAVAIFDELAGVGELQPTATSNGDHITYSVFAARCSSLAAVSQVRDHLDSGVLHKLTAKMVANFFNPITIEDHTCHGYLPIILGACAMSLGCRSLHTAPGYKMFYKKYTDMLEGLVYTAPIMDGAKEQMRKALHGPDGFQPDRPIDFAHFARGPNHSPPTEMSTKACRMIGGFPELYQTKLKREVEGFVLQIILPCYKEDMEYHHDEKLCGGCEMYHGKSLVCSRCKNQVYCGRACQRKDFQRHKIVCRTPEDEKHMTESA